ncbi:MAG TPA: hypothetical protein VIK82_05645 [Porticoccaceae bacterium]
MGTLRRLWPLLILLVAGGLLYRPGLGGGFIFDDYPNLVEDPDWKITSLDLETLHAVIGSGIASFLGRPLAILSFALNHYFTGMDPRAMKLVGVAFHLLNSLLVYFLARRLLALVAIGVRTAQWAAWLLAFAWMAHPLQASTVLYVVQRMEVGALTGVLLSLLAYLRAREAMRYGLHAWPWWIAVVVAGLVGLGFKETALLLPGYTLALECCLLGFRGRSDLRSRPLVLVYVIGVLVALAAFCWKVLPAMLAPEAYAFRDFTLGERLLTQLSVLALYLRQMLLPWPESLWFYYDNFPVSKGLFQPWATFASLLLLLVLATIAVTCRRRWPLTSLGLAWFFVAHALTSNVVPFELVFEHRNYFALLGILLALVQPLAWLGGRISPEIRIPLVALPVIFATVMGGLQIATWGDPMRLATTLASRNPESSRAGYELGRLLFDRAQGDPASPLWSLAEQEFLHAARLPGSSPLPDQALIILAASHGQAVDPEVWRLFREKLTRRRAGPQEIGALTAVVDCRIGGRCAFEDEQALFEVLTATLRVNPDSAVIHAVYGNYAFNVLRDPELGINMLREAVTLDPSQIAFRIGLARFLLASDLRNSPEVAETMAVLRAGKARGMYATELRQLERLMEGGDPGQSPE